MTRETVAILIVSAACIAMSVVFLCWPWTVTGRYTGMPIRRWRELTGFGRRP